MAAKWFRPLLLVWIATIDGIHYADEMMVVVMGTTVVDP